MAQSTYKPFLINAHKKIAFLAASLFTIPFLSVFTTQIYAASFEVNSTISPIQPQVNQPIKILTNINSSENISDAIIDIEVYDSANNKVVQKFFEHQNLQSNQLSQFPYDWSSDKSDLYQVKVGIFSNNWSANYFWQDKSASFRIVSAPTDSDNEQPSFVYKGEYWNLPASSATYSLPASSPDLIRNDNEINFDWGNGSPDPKIQSDNFIARWSRTLQTDSGNYEFKLSSDDGIRLWIDNDLIINQWNDHANTSFTVQKYLSAGDHNVRIEYYENGGGAVAQFNYKKIYNPATTNPTPTPTQPPVSFSNFKGEYWNNSGSEFPSIPNSPPTITRDEKEINFDWGNGSPGTQINSDHFNARWTRAITLNSGNYQFNLESDDGIRFWLDGQLLVDQWNDQATTRYSVNKSLNSGTHEIKIEYYENSGGAVAKFNYSLENSSSVPQPTPIPPSNNSQRYTIGNDGNIYKDGNKIVLRGVSWFGAETGVHAPHGLWSRNWQDMVSQMKSTGFNAVRVPFCPATLKNTGVTSIDYSKNPDLNGLKSLDIMDKVVNGLNNQQMYILLDHHTPDCQAISDLWYTGGYSESQWIQDLVFLANRYKNLEYFIGLDIKNEPKGSATWGTGNTATDWNLAAQRAGKEILANNSNILLFVQGIESNPVCSDNSVGHWWGGNFEPQKCTPLDTSYIPANKVVFTPHVYGPDVNGQSYFSDPSFPANMTKIWDNHFGFLKNSGKAVAIGEFGGKYGNGGVQNDVVWQDSFINYLSSKGICSSFYWDWNPNSGDTGGILQDDWTNVWSNKVNLLQRYYNSCR